MTKKVFEKVKKRLKMPLFKILLLFLLFFSHCSHQEKPPAQAGKADLTHWNFHTSGPVSLEGTWKWKNGSLSPEFLHTPISQDEENFYLPGYWKEPYGYATFTLELLLQQGGDYEILMPGAFTAYDFFVNGEKISSNGVVSTSEKDSVPDLKPDHTQVHLNKYNLLTLRVSNFELFRGGPGYAPRLGLTEDIQSEFSRNLVRQSSIMGLCSIIGLLYTSIWYFRRKEQQFLWFGLFCFIMSLRILSSENIISLAIPVLNFWRLKLTLDYISFYAGVGIFMQFMNSIYDNLWQKRFTQFTLYLGLMLSIISIATPPSFFTQMMPHYGIWTGVLIAFFSFRISRQITRLTLNQYISLLGILLIFATSLHDILFALRMPSLQFRTMSFGLLYFILIHSILLGKNLAQALNTSEHLENNLKKEILKHTKHLNTANETLKNLSYSDPLTGLFNRRRFDETLQNELEHCKNGNLQNLGLIIIDIDFFKNYNDTYGHAKGDQCLEDVAKTLENCLKRTGDLIARYGGEEFAVILPGIDKENLKHIAEEMRKDVEALKIEHSASSCSKFVTISCGASCLSSSDKDISEIVFFEKADKALYCAKQNGRNQVKLHDDF